MLTLNTNRPDRSLWVPVIIAAVGLFLAGVYVAVVMLLPPPQPIVDQSIKTNQVDTGQFAPLRWPNSLQAAIGTTGYSTVVTSYDEEKPLPIASVAKVITALAILKKKPLELNQTGPTIKLSQTDVDLYNSYKAKGGSVVKVTAGEEITQYQAMQAMLIPSANNMAASLAVWAFGSEAAYTEYANKMLSDLGLKSTHVDDASGFSPKTVSTASELVLLGKEAVKNPVIMQITGQTEATIPAAGKVVTTNAVLGKSGITGIKTGHTPESGGCFLFSAEKDAGNGQKAIVIGAIVGAPTIDEARASAPIVAEEGFANLTQTQVLGESVAVGTMLAPWADPVPIVAKKGLSQIVWRGAQLTLKVDITPGDTTGTVGVATLGSDSTQLELQEELPQPSFWWRLTHPVELFNGR